MKQFKAIGASDGIAIARVYKLVEEEINVTNEKVNNIDQEIEKLNKNITISLSEIDKIFNFTEKKLGIEKANIFKAHKLILQDPVIIKEMVSLISKEKWNAAYCVQKIRNQYIETFSSMSEYFKDRIGDIKDVTDRLLRHLLNLKIQDLATINEEVVIVADDLTPSQTAQLDGKFVKAFLCNIGGRTSHAAIMARSLEIPAILGLKDITKKLNDNDLVIVDGNSGLVISNPDQVLQKEWTIKQEQYLVQKSELIKYKDQETITKDGFKVYLESNIGNDSDAKKSLQYGAEGVGLFRTEFLYMESKNWPTEDDQFNAYKNVLQTMNNKMVVIRTLDIGGDKNLSYHKFDPEMNPFLGYRAIRFCLDQTEIFKTQLRALIRASIYGQLAIMFPMISTIEEFKKAKEITKECWEELNNRGVKVAPFENIQIGLMVEIPTTAISAQKFAKYADFLSIGTNDLVQYSMAVDRMSTKISHLYQLYNPSLLQLIKMAIDGIHSSKRIINGKEKTKWAGMCGEMAGDILAVPLLLGLGLDYFSMSSSSILKVRKIINNLKQSDTQELVEKALNLETNAEVKELVQKFLIERELL